MSHWVPLYGYGTGTTSVSKANGNSFWWAEPELCGLPDLGDNNSGSKPEWENRLWADIGSSGLKERLEWEPRVRWVMLQGSMLPGLLLVFGFSSVSPPRVASLFLKDMAQPIPTRNASSRSHQTAPPRSTTAPCAGLTRPFRMSFHDLADKMVSAGWPLLQNIAICSVCKGRVVSELLTYSIPQGSS